MAIKFRYMILSGRGEFGWIPYQKTLEFIETDEEALKIFGRWKKENGHIIERYGNMMLLKVIATEPD